MVAGDSEMVRSVGAEERQPRSLVSSAFRFLIVGGVNTVITGVALALLAQVINPSLAYTIVFAAGVVFAVAMAGGFVFGVKPTPRIVALYTLLYIAVYLVGLLAVSVAHNSGVPEAYSGLVVFITAPLTFLGGRLLFARKIVDQRKLG